MVLIDKHNIWQNRVPWLSRPKDLMNTAGLCNSQSAGREAAQQMQHPDFCLMNWKFVVGFQVS